MSSLDIKVLIVQTQETYTTNKYIKKLPYNFSNTGKGKGKVHPCTGTEALYRPYGP
jgi:hypothetical protein